MRLGGRLVELPPARLVREEGRPVAEGGRSRPVIEVEPPARLVRELGRPAAEGGRFMADSGRSAVVDAGRGIPKERRLTALSLLPVVSAPDPIRLVLLPPVSDAASEVPSAFEPKLLVGRRMLLRMVTEDGRLSPSAEPVRGEFLGVPPLGAGSFDRADWTRSSIFCILPRRLLIWCSESDRGRPSDARVLGREIGRVLGTGGFIAFASDCAVPDDAVDGPRVCLG